MAIPAHYRPVVQSEKPAPWLTPEKARRTIVEAAKAIGVDPVVLTGKCQAAALLDGRAMAARSLKDQGYSLPQIGRFLGGRHHTTVLAMLERYKWRFAGRDAPRVRSEPDGYDPDAPDESGVWAIC